MDPGTPDVTPQTRREVSRCPLGSSPLSGSNHTQNLVEGRRDTSSPSLHHQLLLLRLVSSRPENGRRVGLFRVTRCPTLLQRPSGPPLRRLSLPPSTLRSLSPVSRRGLRHPSIPSLPVPEWKSGPTLVQTRILRGRVIDNSQSRPKTSTTGSGTHETPSEPNTVYSPRRKNF